MNKLINIGLGVLSVFLMVLDVIIPGAGTLMATLQSGVITRENAAGLSYEHLAPEVSKVITNIRPDMYPLDTMVRQIRQANTVQNVEVRFETVTWRGESATVNGAATFTTETSGNITVDDSSMLAVDDTLFVPDVVPANGTGIGAMLLVTAIVSATEITVVALNGHDGSNGEGERLTTVPDNTVMYRASNGKTELDAQTDQIYALPANDSNYCQIKMAQIERSKVEARHKTFSGYNFEDKVNQVMWDFRSKCEKTHFVGVKKQKTVGSDTHYFSDGVISKISQAVNFTTSGGNPAPTLGDIADLAETVFANKAGSDSRVLFAGKKLITGLTKIPDYERTLNGKDKEVVHGVKVSKLESHFGAIYVAYSKTLDNAGYESKGVVLDMEHVFKHDLEPIEVEALDLNTAGTRRTQDALRITENSCITLRYGGASGVHAIWEA